MDFNDTPEEAAFRAEARAFLEKHLELKSGARPRPGSGATALQRAKDWQKTKAENKFAQITWPKEWGGRGGTSMQAVIWGQEESKFDAPTGPFAIGLGMCIPTVIAFGSDEHKSRYVEKALMGEEIWCQLFSEPSAGSDVAGLKTRAVKDGDDWVINGQKVWTSGAHYSDYGILLVRTDPKVPKHKGLTMFIVNMKQAGVEVRPIHQASGGREFNEVYFTDVRIPASARLGEEGQGLEVALGGFLLPSRVSVAMSAVGLAERANELAVEYANTRETFGKKLSSRQAITFYLAENYADIAAARALVFEAARAYEEGRPDAGALSSASKMVAVDMLARVTDKALQVHGGQGYWKRNTIERVYRDARAQRFEEGTNEIQKLVVGRAVVTGRAGF